MTETLPLKSQVTPKELELINKIFLDVSKL